MAGPPGKVTIKIPRPLYDQIQRIVADTGFSSPTEFIVHVLRDLVGGRLGAEEPNAAASLTTEELHAIRRRLKSLGYL